MPTRTVTGHPPKNGGWREDWLATIRQSLVRLPALRSKLRPTYHLPSVAAIDPEFLHCERIRGIIWDVDGTLMGRRHSAVATELQAAVDTLLAHPDVRHVILSNCDSTRFCELGRLFPSVPVLRVYNSRQGLVFRRLLDTHDQWEAAATQPVSSDELRALRKPHVALMEFALQTLDPIPPQDVVMVGDQYLTDIASANLAGLRSIKVPTHAPHTFPPAVRALQLVDSVLARMAGTKLPPAQSTR